MKKLIIATMALGVLTSSVSAGPFDWLDPHKNAFKGLYKKTNGGYSSWKARKRACHNIDGEYNSTNGDCDVFIEAKNYKNVREDYWQTYYSHNHIPDTKKDIADAKTYVWDSGPH